MPHCLAANVEPITVVTEEPPERWLDLVIQLNNERRHLTPPQRALAAARMTNLRRGDNRFSIDVQICTSIDAAAEKWGVRRRYVIEARKVLGLTGHGPGGDPALVKSVETGDCALHVAAEIATVTPEEQRRILEFENRHRLREATRIKQERRKACDRERELRGSRIVSAVKASDRYRLQCCDMREADIAPNSIDAIITDPPYPQEYLETFSWLAERALVWLKPGGTLAVMSGQAWLPEVMRRLCLDGLLYRWTFAYLTPADHVPVIGRRVGSGWKPVFVFTKGAATHRFVYDVIHSGPSTPDDKRDHEWGQSERGMAELVDRLSNPGDVVCDPFCGAGSLGLAALRANRKFWGIDIEQRHVDVTAMRLAGVAREAEGGEEPKSGDAGLG